MRIHAGSLALFHVIVKRVGGHGDERDGFGIRIAHMADVIGRRIHCEGLGDFLDIPGIVFSIDLILFMTSNGFVRTGRGWVWYFLLKLLLFRLLFLLYRFLNKNHLSYRQPGL